MIQSFMFGGDVVRSRILEYILIPVLLVWTVALLLHRSEPRLYNAVDSLLICKVRKGMETIAVLVYACTIGYGKAGSRFRLLDTQDTNVIRLLGLSSCDHITHNATC